MPKAKSDAAAKAKDLMLRKVSGRKVTAFNLIREFINCPGFVEAAGYANAEEAIRTTVEKTMIQCNALEYAYYREHEPDTLAEFRAAFKLEGEG